MPKVFLVNPSSCTTGYSFITPRWLFVIAAATPVEMVGDPVLVDESLAAFDPMRVRPGDIVGIGISTGNCTAGYRVVRQAKTRGAFAVVGGIHATLFPKEPLEMGADAVVTGNGDLIWRRVVEDACTGKLKRRYDGGRVPGDALLKARWDLLDPARYLFPSVQTVAGCPENCSFCSVWVVDGRQPRQRLAGKIIEEIRELYGLGYRFVILADDNFSPATLGRIARETSPSTRKRLERIREERLAFFDEYDVSAPKGIFGCTQMTSEVVGDPEYLSAVYSKARVRQALVGVESFSEEGLRSAHKQWNPAGLQMIETIRRIQDAGIVVLSSVICGLESDTVQTLRTMRQFMADSGTAIAQFTVYIPYPGTQDYYEMVQDRERRDTPGYVPKRRTELLHDRYWLTAIRPTAVIRHPNLSAGQLVAERRKCWDTYYSLREIIRRIRTSMPRNWSWGGKLTYLVASVAFRRLFAGDGISADSARREKLGLTTRALLKLSLGVYCLSYRWRRLGLAVPLTRRAAAAGRWRPHVRAR